MITRNYPSCNIIGNGKLNNDVSFKIIDLSAERIRIKTDAPIKIKHNVNLAVSLDAGLFEITIKSKGFVSQKVPEGYEIKFTDISDIDRNEINELMKSSCNID